MFLSPSFSSSCAGIHKGFPLFRSMVCWSKTHAHLLCWRAFTPSLRPEAVREFDSRAHDGPGSSALLNPVSCFFDQHDGTGHLAYKVLIVTAK